MKGFDMKRPDNSVMSPSGTLLLPSMVLFVVTLAACDECKVDSDCGEDEICASGSCKAKPEEIDTSSSSDSTDGNSAPEETDSSDPTDSEEENTDSESSETPDGGTTVDPGENGFLCEDDDECHSDHCQNGYCCEAGDCCGTPGDNSGCPVRECESSFCDGNFHCQYNLVPCGGLDLNGDAPCRDDRRCDGAGNCVSVTPCGSSEYTGSGAFECDGDDILEACRTACSSNSHCNEGFSCIGSECSVLLENGEVGCESNIDCVSGHCDLDSATCCNNGTCCAEDADCGRYACSTTSWSCLTTCAVDGEDDEARCSEAADYHCDNGWCYDDLANGERWCDEPNDCLSGYCDMDSAICCTSGRCCEVDDDCNGARCLTEDGFICADTCTVAGVDDDTLCAAGFACQDGRCVSGALQNGDSCDNNTQCASGHCDNGYCCATGECCATVADCTADSLCNTASCLGNKQCAYYPLACASRDLSNGETCSGEFRCDGHGGCVAVSGCEGGYVGDTFECGEGVVAYVCPTACADDDDCEEAFHCDTDLSECAADLLSGEGPCDQNTDCASGNCNEVTGVCCDSGYCCNDNAQCEAFLLQCDPETDSCLAACTLDSDCDALGDYHCDDGACEPDLLNGEQFCEADTECLSGYCDVISSICCDSGTCCMADGDCGSFACSDTYSCIEDCAGDSGLCSDGYYCDGSICLPKAPNGSTCIESADCQSGYCDTVSGVCCDGGDCCGDATECDDGNDCTIDLCSAGFQCYTANEANGESCSDGEYCNGPEICMEGSCTSGTAPCQGETVCRVESCDEIEDECVVTPRNAGQPCSDTLYCLGGVAKVCTETGLCLDPGTGTPPCTGDTGDPCTDFECDEAGEQCDEVPVANGTPCDDDPCNGNNTCQDGVCEPATDLPCEDGDPCTADACTNNGGTAVCGANTPIADGELCQNAPCMGETATCEQGMCVPAAERPCIDGDLCTADACYKVVDGIECSQRDHEPFEVTCGVPATMTGEHFENSEYYAYGGTCTGTFDGLEGVFSVDVATAGEVTVALSNPSPAMDLEIMRLTDWCTPTSCTDHNTNTLTVAVSPGLNVFVLEAPVATVPMSVDVTVTCP